MEDILEDRIAISRYLIDDALTNYKLGFQFLLYFDIQICYTMIIKVNERSYEYDARRNVPDRAI
ncbi:hypothetical protein ACTQO1_07055, partial [Streptococcus pneumoniae]